MGQLDKLNDRGDLCPFDSQLRSLSDARGKVLVQFDIRTALMGWPAVNDQFMTLGGVERGEDTYRLLTI